MCTQDIVEVARAMPTFLKLNTIPIICCQEDTPTAKTYFATSFPMEPMVQQLMYVTGIGSEVQHAFGLKTAPVSAHIKAMPKMIPLLLKGHKFELPKTCVVDPLVEFGLFLIDKGGKLIRNWEFKQLGARPDYGLYLIDMEKELQSTMEDVETLMKMFPLVKQYKRKILEVPCADQTKSKLEQVMQDKRKRKQFKIFMVNEHCVENMLFIV